MKGERMKCFFCFSDDFLIKFKDYSVGEVYVCIDCALNIIEINKENEKKLKEMIDKFFKEVTK